MPYACRKYSYRCTINTVPYMHFCVSSISAWWFVWRFCYIRNVILFPTHLMCTRHSISERLSTYSWFQPGSVKFILLCKYSCIPLTIYKCKYSKALLTTNAIFLLFQSIIHHKYVTSVLAYWTQTQNQYSPQLMNEICNKV